MTAVVLAACSCFLYVQAFLPSVNCVCFPFLHMTERHAVTMSSTPTQPLAPSLGVSDCTRYTSGLHSCLPHEELSHVWELRIAPKLSLTDLSSLAEIDSGWYHAMAVKLSSSRTRQLMAALTSAVRSEVNRDSTLSSGTALKPNNDKSNELLKILALAKSENNPDGSDTGNSIVKHGSARSVIQALQHFNCLRPWGPILAATPGLLQDFTQLFTVPHLPKMLAYLFIQHLGVHMTYQQLLILAHEGVAGVEVWVQAQQRLRIQTNIPDVAVKLCCGTIDKTDLDEWQPTDAADLVNHLQLVYNISSLSTAIGPGSAANLLNTRALSLMRDPAFAAALNCQVAKKLLRTAVVRGHCCAPQLIVSFPAVQQAAAAVVSELLHTVVSAGSATPYSLTQDVMSEAVCDLVQLPAAKHLTTNQWLCIVKAAWKVLPQDGLQTLFQLPAASQASTEVIGQLFLAAAEGLSPGPAGVYGRLLQLSGAVRMLCAIPNAAHVLPAEALSLTHALVTCTVKTHNFERGTFAALGSLQVVQKFTATEVLTLFDALGLEAVYEVPSKPRNVVYEWLLTLPAAPNMVRDLALKAAKLAIQQQHVLELLSTASQIDSEVGRDMQKVLCKLPAAWRFSPRQMMSLLSGVVKNDCILEPALCRLPAAAKLSSNDIQELIQAAEQCENTINLDVLRELQAAT